MFAFVVVRTSLGRQRESRADHIGHLGQNGRGALLAIVLNNQGEITYLPRFHGGADSTSRNLGADFVAPDRLETGSA